MIVILFQVLNVEMRPDLLIIIIIIIADNKSFQRELTSPLTSIKLNKNNIKSLVLGSVVVLLSQWFVF